MPRHSAAVYRRRRLVVVIGLLLVIAMVVAGVWLAVAQPWAASDSSPKKPASSSSSSASSSPEPTTAETTDAATPSPTASETPEIVACEAADVEVRALTDAEAYEPGALPQLSIELINKSGRDCTINVGSSTQRFVVSSGSDVWWQSVHCQEEPSDMFVTLKAGTSVKSVTPVVWDRTRSSVDTCQEKNRPRAPAGGASYHVAVEIGGFASVQSKQFILR